MSESESGLANFFYQLLNEEVARIARVFHSDQLPDIGAAAIRARPLNSGLSDTENRAIDAVEKGEVKSVIGFVFAEIINQFRDLGARPDYVVTGIVVLRSREIVASAQFVPLRGRESRSLEASSAEVAAVRYQAPRPLSRPGAVAARSAAAEGQQDAERLADVARVLACKLSQCWMATEQSRLDRRHVRLNRWRAWLHMFRRTRSVQLAAGAMSFGLPATWQTIHDQVSAMNSLEVR